MTTPMLEKSARAIREHRDQVHAKAGAFWFNGESEAMARAVLTALLEPDEGAALAGAAEHDDWNGKGTIGALNAERNTKQIVLAYLKHILKGEGNV